MSRRPSPIRLKAKTVMRIASPGKTESHGALVRYCVPSRIIVPQEGWETTSPGDTVQANVQEMAERARELGQGLQQGLGRETEGSGERSATGTVLIGAALIVLGGFLLLNQFNLFGWIRWEIMWPFLIILLGVALLVARLRE